MHNRNFQCISSCSCPLLVVAEAAQKCLKDIRDTYSQNVRKIEIAKSGSGQTPEINWPFWESMHWLKDYQKKYP